jgi:hypothetical protein
MRWQRHRYLLVIGFGSVASQAASGGGIDAKTETANLGIQPVTIAGCVVPAVPPYRDLRRCGYRRHRALSVDAVTASSASRCGAA